MSNNGLMMANAILSHMVTRLLIVGVLAIVGAMFEDNSDLSTES